MKTSRPSQLSQRRLQIASLVSKFGSPIYPNDKICLVANYAFSTKLLNCNSILVSFGLHNDATFEIAASSFFNRVMAADPTPISRECFEFCTHFEYLNIAVGLEDGTFFFESNDNGGKLLALHSEMQPEAQREEYICQPTRAFTLISFMKQYKLNQIDVLKLDIDSFEQEIVEQQILESGILNIPQITMEVDVSLNNLNQVRSFLSKLEKKYKIYFIPNKLRYNSLEILCILKP